MKNEEKIEIIQHIINGGEVQYRIRHCEDKEWYAVANPVWNFVDCEYRKKPVEPRTFWIQPFLTVTQMKDEKPAEGGWIEVVEVIK